MKTPLKVWSIEFKDYTIPDDFNDPKHFVASSAFGGTSKRCVGVEIETIIPEDFMDLDDEYFENHTLQCCESFTCAGICGKGDLAAARVFYEQLQSISSTIGFEDDGSLGARGIEIQTSPKSGKDFITQTRQICKLLNDNKFQSTQRCGLHIHLDAADYVEDINKVAYLVAFYARLEPYIYHSIVQTSRLNNKYCLPIAASVKKLSINELIKKEPRKTKYEKMAQHDLIRRWGIDVSYLGNEGDFSDDTPNIEIRYHHGSIDADEILAWTEFNQTIFDYVSTSYDAGKTDTLDKILGILHIAGPVKTRNILTNVIGVRDKVIASFKKHDKTGVTFREIRKAALTPKNN